MAGWIGHRLAAAVVGTAMAMAQPMPAWAQSLTDALILAYDSSNILEQQRALLRGLDDDVAVAVAALRPTLSYRGTAGIDYDDVRGNSSNATLGVVLDYTILDGGQRAFRIGAAKEAVLAARWNLVQFEQEVLLLAVDAYLNLVLAARIVDVRESNLRLLDTQLAAARDRFEVGEVTRTDVSIAEARRAAARSALAAARGQVDIQRERYRLATGHLPGANLQGMIPTPELPPTVERAQALAVQINPTIKSSQHDITASRLLVQIADAARRPTLSFQGNAGVASRGVENAGIGLDVRGPIYDGGAISARTRNAIAGLQARQAGLLQQARAVTDNVGQAWAFLQIARAQVIASNEQVRSAQLAFEGFREEALLGARTTLDVLDAEQELLDARTARLEAQTEAELAVYRVMAAIGLLTTDHLGLRVERYDPSRYYNAVRTAPTTRPTQSVQGSRLDRVLQRFGRD
ncbi:TolC family outer membrane protein [Jannaschia sp. LMIT008]|uniref:TolC family outer membrane protein n=1 Tax=Jannaschia maritima TaxID=3032585 RepID=UPI0028112D39|nr:TolC family outer membrane protein [Jannaschia sp. LMIT008]